MEAPPDLRARGLLFWQEVTESVSLDPSGFVVLGEACRVIDRLDRLSAALNGEGRDWIKLADEAEVLGGVHGKVHVQVVVDGLLSEGRQQQLALKTLLAQLGLAKATANTSGHKSALQQWLEERSG